MKSAKPFDWAACVRSLTPARLALLASERGYSGDILTWLHERGLIGLHNGCIAFPVHDQAGAIVGCHYRTKLGGWLYTKGTRTRPLVIGDIASARRIHGFESPWDAFEFCDKTQAHIETLVAIIITRGAPNGARIKGLIPADAEVFAWPQNDPEERRNAKTGKTPAEGWLSDVVKNAGVKVHAVLTARAHKDLNDWGKSGGTAQDYLAAMNGAQEITTTSTSGNSSKPSRSREKRTPMLDDETLSRLAKLPPLEYERQREREAKRLRCRPSVLDRLVKALRGQCDAAALQGEPVNLPEVEPWPQSVNASDVLDSISARFARFVALPAGAADALALWCAHAHCFHVFICSPRLHITSPEKGCGKTTTRDVIALFVPRPLLTENLSAAVLFRLVARHAPTVIADECDAWLMEKEELRGLLNAGHRRGAMVFRCDGEKNEVRGFAAFAPAVLVGIGALPGTLHDRSIVVRLHRAKPGEVTAHFDPRRVEHEHELCRKLARWCADNSARLESANPNLPDGVFNRLADNWRPLFAIAEIAGGDWPHRAAVALAQLTSRDDGEGQSLGVQLLEDIRRLFAEIDGDKISSAMLAAKLVAMEGRLWAEMGRTQKPLTPTLLSRLLRPFGIVSTSKRDGSETFKGYLRAQFDEAFSRYLS